MRDGILNTAIVDFAPNYCIMTAISNRSPTNAIIRWQDTLLADLMQQSKPLSGTTAQKMEG